MSFYSFGQKNERFPNNIDVSDLETTKCQCSLDLSYVKRVTDSLDFQGYRESYDSSKIRYVDLNFDGESEVLHFFTSSMRGWPYDFLSIYQISKDKTLKKIGDFSSFLLSFAESDGNYLQINKGSIQGLKTNPIYYNTVYRYDGKEYAPYYSPNKTKGEFEETGLLFYKQKDFQKALTNFQNALLTPHHMPDFLLHDANNVAITMIKLGEYENAETLLNKYITLCQDNKELGAAYYNLGLASENLKQYDTARMYFKKSWDYNKTIGCEEKLKKYAR